MAVTNDGPTNGQLKVLDLNTGDVTRLGLAGTSPRFISTGHLVYATEDGSVRGVAFDATTLEVTGAPVTLVEGVQVKPSGAANFSISDDGRLVYIPGERGLAPVPRYLAWVDRSGTAEVVETIPADTFDGPRLSPDGARLLVRAEGDFRIYELDSGRETRVTTDGLASNYGEWAPDGSEVAYSRIDAQGTNIWRQPADGTGEARRLTAMDGKVHVDSWSPDGHTLALHQHQDGGVGNNEIGIVFLPLDRSDPASQDVLERDSLGREASFSPDGRHVAYLSGETGQFEVYIRPFPGPGERRPVSVGGGAEPLWAPNGELFYMRPSDAMMMVVSVTLEPTLVLGPAIELSRRAPRTGTFRRRYDVTKDGKRFLLSSSQLRSGDDRPGGSDREPLRDAAHIVVVLNWTQELLARVPVN